MAAATTTAGSVVRIHTHPGSLICPVSRGAMGSRRERVSSGRPAHARATMSDVPPPPPSLLLVLGDEEFLAARAIAQAVAAARAADPDADVREYEAGALAAGEVAEMLSPSLFGGRR